MAAKQLWEIVREVFPDRYDPTEALRKLFSFPYLPEQDHHPDYLLALQEKYDQHKARLFTFLDCIEAGRESDDVPFAQLYDRILQVHGYASYADMVRKWEEVYEHLKTISSGRSTEPPPKESARIMLYDNVCAGASPSRLCALWMIQHEAHLDDREQTYLVEIIATWPSWRKERSTGDTMHESIYAKMKSALSTKSFRNGEERMQRRHVFYRSPDAESLPDIGNALHDVDHALGEWAYTLGVPQ